MVTTQAVVGVIKKAGLPYIKRHQDRRNGRTVKAGCQVMQLGRLIAIECCAGEDAYALAAAVTTACEAAGLKALNRGNGIVVVAR